MLNLNVYDAFVARLFRNVEPPLKTSTLLQFSLRFAIDKRCERTKGSAQSGPARRRPSVE